MCINSYLLILFEFSTTAAPILILIPSDEGKFHKASILLHKFMRDKWGRHVLLHKTIKNGWVIDFKL